MTASRSLNHRRRRRRRTTGPGVARLPQVGRGVDGAAAGRRVRQAAVTRVAGRARAECHGRRASFHTPAQISQCFSETCQRHPGAQRAFLIFWQWGKRKKKKKKSPPRAARCLCCHWDGLVPFFLSGCISKWGEPGLAPPLGLLRSSDTLLGKTRESRKAARKTGQCPATKAWGPRPGAS